MSDWRAAVVQPKRMFARLIWGAPRPRPNGLLSRWRCGLRFFEFVRDDYEQAVRRGIEGLSN